MSSSGLFKAVDEGIKRADESLYDTVLKEYELCVTVQSIGKKEWKSYKTDENTMKNEIVWRDQADKTSWPKNTTINTNKCVYLLEQKSNHFRSFIWHTFFSADVPIYVIERSKLSVGIYLVTLCGWILCASLRKLLCVISCLPQGSALSLSVGICAHRRFLTGLGIINKFYRTFRRYLFMVHNLLHPFYHGKWKPTCSCFILCIDLPQ